METLLKQRLVGIAVIVSLAVIFLPMLLDGAGMTETSRYKSIELEVPPPPQVVKRSIDFDVKEKQLTDKVSKIPAMFIPKAATKSEIKPAIKKKEASKKSIVKTESWVVQVGSFKDKKKADDLKKKITAYKMGEVFLQEATLKKGKNYRVRIGLFSSIKKAEAISDKLNAKHKLKSVVLPN